MSHPRRNSTSSTSSASSTSLVEEILSPEEIIRGRNTISELNRLAQIRDETFGQINNTPIVRPSQGIYRTGHIRVRTGTIATKSTPIINNDFNLNQNIRYNLAHRKDNNI